MSRAWVNRHVMMRRMVPLEKQYRGSFFGLDARDEARLSKLEAQ
jgi:hypothetical protein